MEDCLKHITISIEFKPTFFCFQFDIDEYLVKLWSIDWLNERFFANWSIRKHVSVASIIINQLTSLHHNDALILLYASKSNSFRSISRRIKFREILFLLELFDLTNLRRSLTCLTLLSILAMRISNVITMFFLPSLWHIFIFQPKQTSTVWCSQNLSSKIKLHKFDTKHEFFWIQSDSCTTWKYFVSIQFGVWKTFATNICGDHFRVRCIKSYPNEMHQISQTQEKNKTEHTETKLNITFIRFVPSSAFIQSHCARFQEYEQQKKR